MFSFGFDLERQSGKYKIFGIFVAFSSLTLKHLQFIGSFYFLVQQQQQQQHSLACARQQSLCQFNHFNADCLHGPFARFHSCLLLLKLSLYYYVNIYLSIYLSQSVQIYLSIYLFLLISIYLPKFYSELLHMDTPVLTYQHTKALYARLIQSKGPVRSDKQ